jgi:hypothetical protein
MPPQPVSFDTVANSLKDVESSTDEPEDGKASNTMKYMHLKPAPTRSTLEQVMFPDITGLPYSERELTQIGGVTFKVAGADRKDQWWSDVLMGRRYIEIVTCEDDLNKPESDLPAIREEGPKPAV